MEQSTFNSNPNQKLSSLPTMPHLETCEVECASDEGFTTSNPVIVHHGCNSSNISDQKRLNSGDQLILVNGYHNKVHDECENDSGAFPKSIHATALHNHCGSQPQSSTDDDGSQQTLSSSINSDSEVNGSVCSDKGNHDMALDDTIVQTSDNPDDVDSGICSGGSFQCIAKESCVTNCFEDASCAKNNANSDVESLLDTLEKTSLKEKIHKSSFDVINGISYVVYESEKQMPDIMRLITKDLSEPYSIYTYRYFIHNWPKLCFLAMADNKCVGAIVCKLDLHKKMVLRGYIAMLAVDSEYRRRQIGSTLVTKAIQAMIKDDCGEVVLETEITNKAALQLYENLGFVRDKRLFRYYLNGVDALRLKLWLR